MQTFLIILIVLAALGAVAALVRGVIIFLRASHMDVHGGTGASASGIGQNKMMRTRILFQALAVILVILLLLLARGG